MPMLEVFPFFGLCQNTEPIKAFFGWLVDWFGILAQIISRTSVPKRELSKLLIPLPPICLKPA